MYLIKLETHLEITKPEMQAIADQIGMWFSRWSAPIEWKIIEWTTEKIVEEFFDELPHHIKEAVDIIDNLKDEIERIQETIAPNS